MLSLHQINKILLQILKTLWVGEEVLNRVKFCLSVSMKSRKSIKFLHNPAFSYIMTRINILFKL